MDITQMDPPLRPLAGSARPGSPPPFCDHDCTKRFAQAFHCSSSIAERCDGCGRVYFDSNENGYDEDELERYQAQEASDPDRYIDYPGGPAWGQIGDLVIVAACDCHFSGWLEEQLGLPPEATEEDVRYALGLFERDRLAALLEQINIVP